MKKLQYILSNIQTIATIGNLDIPIQEICIDSRKANQYSLFVAIKGTHLDSHQFIEDVIEKGIVAIVCQQLPNKIHENVAYILVEDTSFTLGFISSNFFDEPSTKLKVIGITGTNGKTTCATLAYQLFTSLGFTCGLISTVENIIGTEKFPATHTTPDAISLQQLLHQMVESKCEYVFMEVSSHAIHQHRIAGLHFAGACFTNITHEHLDYHSNFEEYIRVKKILFDGLDKSAFALTNLDDKRGAVMLQNTKARKKSYALKTMADYKGKIIENNLTGLVMSINQAEIFFRMIGEFNAYNLLCVYGIACELEMDKQLTLQY